MIISDMDRNDGMSTDAKYVLAGTRKDATDKRRAGTSMCCT